MPRRYIRRTEGLDPVRGSDMMIFTDQVKTLKRLSPDEAHRVLCSYYDWIAGEDTIKDLGDRTLTFLLNDIIDAHKRRVAKYIDGCDRSGPGSGRGRGVIGIKPDSTGLNRNKQYKYNDNDKDNDNTSLSMSLTKTGAGANVICTADAANAVSPAPLSQEQKDYKTFMRENAVTRIEKLAVLKDHADLVERIKNDVNSPFETLEVISGQIGIDDTILPEKLDGIISEATEKYSKALKFVIVKAWSDAVGQGETDVADFIVKRAEEFLAVIRPLL